MRIEHEIKKDDGTKFQFIVNVWEYTGSGFVYDVSLYTKAKRKKTWLAVIPDDVTWRQTSTEDRPKLKLDHQLQFVTKEEINQALTKAWESIKPKMIE